jgi:hypothetical protein
MENHFISCEKWKLLSVYAGRMSAPFCAAQRLMRHEARRGLRANCESVFQKHAAITVKISQH